MNKYPLDSQAIDEAAKDLVATDRALRAIVRELSDLLKEAMKEPEAEDSQWYDDARDLFKEIDKRRSDYETHHFNQKNGYNTKDNSPYLDKTTDHLGRIDIYTEQQLNKMEESFGEEMSEESLAKYFGEKKPKKKKVKKNKQLTKEEAEAWERAQENSNDIYRVSARIKNLARASVKANLTQQGDMVVNAFTHIIKAFYDFAETIEDKNIKIKLVELTKKQEEMPANLISALGAGITLK